MICIVIRFKFYFHVGRTISRIVYVSCLRYWPSTLCHYQSILSFYYTTLIFLFEFFRAVNIIDFIKNILKYKSSKRNERGRARKTFLEIQMDYKLTTKVTLQYKEREKSEASGFSEKTWRIYHDDKLLLKTKK